MHARVERDSERIHDFESVAGKRLEQLLLDHQCATHHGRHIGRGRIDVREAGKVVERFEQTAHNGTLPVLLGALPLASGALPEIVELGGEAQVFLALFVQRRAGLSALGFENHRKVFITGVAPRTAAEVIQILVEFLGVASAARLRCV